MKAHQWKLLRATMDLVLAMERGEVQPESRELEALAIVCEREGLSEMAVRVRRWIPDATSLLIR